MRHSNLLVTPLTLGAILAVTAACTTHQQRQVIGNAAFAPASVTRAKMGRAELWSAQCSRCHNVRARAEYNTGQWAVVVNHMRTVADLPGADYRSLLEFLADRTPAPDRSSAKITASKADGAVTVRSP